MKQGILIALLFIQVCFIHSQNADSVKLLLKKDLHDTMRCNALAILVEIEPDERLWTAYNEELKQRCEAFLTTAAPSHPMRMFYLKHLAEALNNSGYLAMDNGEIALAIEHYNKSISISEEVGYNKALANTLLNLGYIYRSQSDIPKAIECYSKSLKLQESAGDKEGIANALNNLGNLYRNLDDPIRALEYFNRALKNYQAVESEKGIATSLSNIGSIYQVNGDYPKALDHYEKSLSLHTRTNNQEGIAQTLLYMGITFTSIQDYEKAKDYFLRSLEVRERIGDKQGISTTLFYIAKSMSAAGDDKAARSYGERSLSIAKELGYHENIRNSSRILAHVYAKLADWRNAYHMQVLFKEMSDSINNETNKKAALQKAFQYEYEKKKAQDSIRVAEERMVHAIQLKQEQTQRYALYGGLALIAVFSAFIFNRFRITQKQKKLIEAQKKIVDQAYDQLNQKNREVMDSILYAKRIQRALITSEKYVAKILTKLRSPKSEN